MTSVATGGSETRRTLDVVDCLVHPVPSDRSLRAHMSEPWRTYPLNQPFHNVYPPPFGEYRPDVATTAEPNAPRPDGLGAAGTTETVTQEQARSDLLETAGVKKAILLPLGRGVQADGEFEAATAAAMNEWLVQEWLSDTNADGRFKGSIRVCPRSPKTAVKEIEKWAAHPHLVQVAVPLQATSPYGEQQYWPVWEAAAAAGLPIVVHADTGSGIEPVPTAVGSPLTTYGLHVLQPLNAAIHLASLVAQGVFARFEALQWVLTDGAYSAYAPLFWRFDNEWRESRFQTPWVAEPPTHYLARNVHFVIRSTDVSADLGRTAAALQLAHGEAQVMYGSGYPYWSTWTASEARDLIPPEFAEPVFHLTAEKLYGLG